MSENEALQYEADPNEPLSTEVVAAIAQAHNEDVLDQKWRISDDINTDALDNLFRDQNLGIRLQFDADMATVSIIADERGNPVINIESHR
jgi:hypothetical protein